MSQKIAPIAVAMTGASGADYGLRLLELLIQNNEEVYLMLSDPAKMVINMETSLKLPTKHKDCHQYLLKYFKTNAAQLHLYEKNQWTAPVASGSGSPRAMVVCPCTTGTLAAIACGASDNLMERAADVVLKERKKLIMVIRETPFSDIHLENMLRLSRMGAVIMPANPGYYHQPQAISDIIDFIVAKILDQLDIAHQLIPTWGLKHD